MKLIKNLRPMGAAILLALANTAALAALPVGAQAPDFTTDAALFIKSDMADRISYVISPQGKVLYVYSSLSPDKHVENTLKAVEKWRASQRP